MFCNQCLTLALFPQNHKCINCPRLCKTKQEKWCSYCSSIRYICAVCGKPIQKDGASRQEKVKTQIQKTHPFFNGGCKSCGK